MGWLAHFLSFLLFHLHFHASSSLSFSFNSSSSAMLCQHDQSLALLQFKKTFSIRSDASPRESDFPYHPKPYPKTVSWKEGTDCCSWDGITCDLETEYFNNFKAMVNSDVKMEYMRDPNNSYDYSVSLTLKGLEIELVKIQTLLTTIDLSSNKFTGKIPQLIGKLKALKQLNLSHNQLTGNIQPSLGNLSNLESLDLSSNLFVGRIPMQLVDLTFLQVFRVSHNRLEGPIPEGNQFNTFDNTSYEGNLGLCGFPLEKCNSRESQQSAASKEDDSESKIGFGWKVVLAGYGCGVIFGIAMGYVVFKTRNPAWFVRMVEGYQKPKRFKN
ncbi:hypothetical protein P3X46_025642 [Hevea brasiliensis]|uniref:Leucine-rich repeat-containing N-terminal plant-type domain-containing protein n=1 Tax=Hevea brasiliensis TaxID=3981 RepID=A0ABQ9L7T4_HEVBR|nr:hypothetical protein P3X46_025642 [Hevea brasiliensis]